MISCFNEEVFEAIERIEGGCFSGIIVVYLYSNRNDMLTTSEIIMLLRGFKAKFGEKYGIKTLGIFGSFARKQQNLASDLDVVVTLEESDFFTLVAIQEELEKLTACKVDVVNFRDSLRDSFKANILKDAIFV